MSEPTYHYTPHPLDELQLFGFADHGLLRGGGGYGTVRDVDGTLWPLRWGHMGANGHPMQIISRPGIGPAPLSPEKLATERDQGRVWQNYSLLSSDWNLYGRVARAWVYWDSSNDPWLIQPSDEGNLQLGAGDDAVPFGLTLRCVRAQAAQEHAPIELVVGVDDTTQRAVMGASSDRFFRFFSINRRGSRAIIQVTAGSLTVDPIGYLQVELSDAAEGVSASMSVLRSQGDTLGEWEQSYPDGHIAPYDAPLKLYDYYATGTLSPDSGEPRYPVGRGSSTLTLDGYEAREQTGVSTSSLLAGAHVEYARRTGRLVRLAFDDQDELVEFRVDSDRTTEYDYPHPDIEVGGSFTGAPTDNPAVPEPENGFPFSNSQWSGSATVHLSRTVRETFRARLTLRRNGVTVAEDELVRELKSDQALAFIRATAGGSSWAAPRKTPGGTWGMAGIINYVNTAIPGNGYTLLTDYDRARAPVTSSLEAIGPYGGKILLDVRSSGTPIDPYRRLVGSGDMPLRADDFTSVRLPLSVSSYEPDSYGTHEAITAASTDGLGVILNRTITLRNSGVTISTQRSELSLHFVAASAPGRGPISWNETAVAYHPVTHEIVTDQTGGAPITFV